MKLSRTYLSAFLIATTFSSTVFADKSKQYSKEEILKAIYKPESYPKTLFWVWSPNIKELESKFAQTKTPQDMFGLYCQSGKPVRKLTTRIRAIVPRAPQGLPVTTAAKIVEDQKERIKDSVSKFYFKAARGLKGSFNQCVDHNNNDDLDNVTFPGAFHADIEHIVLDFKSERAQKPRQDNMDTTSFVFVDRDHPILLVPQGLTEFEWRGEGGSKVGKKVRPVGLTDKSEPLAPDSIKKAGHSFCKISKNAFSPALVQGDDPSIFPGGDIVFIEWLNLFSRYTMLIPKDVQKDYFKEKHNHSSGHHFIDSDGNFQIERAVSRNGLVDLWEDYLLTATTVKEAQSTDPQIIDYEVELDLKLFCAYGRPLSDLVSK